MNEDGRWITTKSGNRVFIKNKDVNDYMNDKIRKSVNKEYNIDNIAKTFEDNYDKLKLSDLKSKYVNGEDKNLCLKLQELKGFNEKPIQMNEEQYNNLKDDKYFTMYRGFHDSISVKGSEYKRQFVEEKNSYGVGEVKFGIGHYFIDNYDDALYYGNYEKPNVLEIKLPRNAKGIEYNVLREKFYNVFDKYNSNKNYYQQKYGNNVINLLENMNYNNTSALAILEGYDYVYSNNVCVILNRGKIIVKK